MNLAAHGEVRHFLNNLAFNDFGRSAADEDAMTDEQSRKEFYLRRARSSSTACRRTLDGGVGARNFRSSSEVSDDAALASGRDRARGTPPCQGLREWPIYPTRSNEPCLVRGAQQIAPDRLSG